MGAVSASGLGVKALWEAAQTGQSGIGEATLLRPAGNRAALAAEVPSFDPKQHVSAELLPVCDRFAQFAMIAAQEALSQAGLSSNLPLGGRAAVILGTAIGSGATLDQAHYDFYVLERRADVFTVPRVMPNAASSLLSIHYGCRGPAFTVSRACASALQACGLGMWLVRNDLAALAIGGGSEASITPCSFRCWEAIRVLTTDYCRPFSKGRNGTVLGEGAGIFVLEAADAARARRAAPVASEN